MTTRARIADLLARRMRRQRDVALSAARSLVAAAGERDLTLSEETRVEQWLADADRLEERLARIEVRREPLTYERDGPYSFFADVVRTRNGVGDPAAERRLARHAEEMDVEIGRRERRAEAELARRSSEGGWTIERRDLSRVDGAGGEFVPPLWIMDLYAPIARGGRVLAALATNIPLPMGTDQIHIPRASAGGSVAPQSADNAAIDRVDLATNSIVLPVRTITGEQRASLQLLEQSPQPGFDVLMYSDLMGDYNDKLGVQVMNGPGTAGQIAGLLTVAGTALTYTDASPSVQEFQVKIADAASQAATARKLPMTAVLMAPRRWYWTTAAVDMQNRPLVPPTGAVDRPPPEDADSPVGSMCTIPAYLDPGIPLTLGGGTEDRVIVTRPSDHLLFESAPRLRVLKDPLSGTLGARVQFYRYVAWTAERHPTGTSVLSGSGLAAPVFA